MTHTILFTKQPTITDDVRTNKVELNVLAHVVEGTSYRSAVSRANSWAINKMSSADYDRLGGVLNSLACDDIFQCGEYSVIVRQL